jgi:hypothetical protein
MYWLMTLDSIYIVSGVLSVVLTFLAIGAFCAAADCRSVPWWFAAVLGVAAALMLAIAVFTPTTKQMAAILVVPKIANSEKVQVAGDKLYDLAVEWLEELRPEKQRKEEKK